MTPCPMCGTKTLYHFDKNDSLWHYCVCGYLSCLTEVQKNGITVHVRKAESSRFKLYKDSLPHKVLGLLSPEIKRAKTLKSIASAYVSASNPTTELPEIALSIIYLLTAGLVDYVSVIDRRAEVSYWKMTTKGKEVLASIV